MSRGAGRAVLVESHPAAIAQLKANQTKLKASQMTIMAGDAQRLLSVMQDQFDVILKNYELETACNEAEQLVKEFLAQ